MYEGIVLSTLFQIMCFNIFRSLLLSAASLIEAVLKEVFHHSNAVWDFKNKANLFFRIDKSVSRC